MALVLHRFRAAAELRLRLLSRRAFLTSKEFGGQTSGGPATSRCFSFHVFQPGGEQAGEWKAPSRAPSLVPGPRHQGLEDQGFELELPGALFALVIFGLTDSACWRCSFNVGSVCEANCFTSGSRPLVLSR